jgi:amidase
VARVAGSELAFSSAVALLERLERRELSARELVDACAARIEARNTEVNAVVALDVERARAEAAAVDDARARGESLGPLAGLPVTIKDAYEVAGFTATCGLPSLADHRPERDADAVARLRGAGAVVVGKTNTPAGAANWQTYNDLYGVTRNPWNLERTVGGSSGGSAASIASGFAPLELGSDIAGSIRVPSHFCGVYGLKPSYGIVSIRGHIPPLPGELLTVPLGVAGPLARSAADLELALDVLAGPDELEATGWRLELPPPRHERLADFRVGVWLGDEVYRVDGAYREAIEGFVADLGAAGARVVGAEPPLASADRHDLYLRTFLAIVGAPAPDEPAAFAALAGEDDTGYADRFSRLLAASVGDWFGFLERREHLFRAFRDFFQDVDVLVCPVAMTVAFPHDTGGKGVHSDQLFRRLLVDGEPVPYFDNFTWPGLATSANLPSAAVPTGRLVGGLPAGVQLIGPYLEDRTPLRLARLAEAGGIGGFSPPPDR